MIDIQGQSGKMEDPLNTSKTMAMRNRSSNGRFKSTKKRASKSRSNSKEASSNPNEVASTLEKSTTELKTSQRKRPARNHSPRSEKSMESDASEVSSMGNRPKTRMSRRLERDVTHTSEDHSMQEKVEHPTESSDHVKSVENHRKRRRVVEDHQGLSATPSSKSNEEDPSPSTSKENEAIPESAKSSSLEKTQENTSLKKPSQASKKSKAKNTKKATSSKQTQIAKVQVSYIYLPKTEHSDAIQRLEDLRVEYKKLSLEVENWHAEIKRLTEPEATEPQEEAEEEEEEIIPLIVQRPQRTRRKPARILYDL